MTNPLTRRNFLKVGALATAATVVSGCTPQLHVQEYLESYTVPPEYGLPGESVWYASACGGCADGCGIIVRTSNGRARKIEGNPTHPVNRGRLCAQGQAMLQETYNPDRLRNAVRQDQRGSRRFTPLYWEDALGLLREQIAGADPASIAFLGGSTSTSMAALAAQFMTALGGRAPLFYTLADELDGRRAVLQASEQIFGSAAMPIYNLAGADIVYSFGADFLATGISTLMFAREYSTMRRRPFGRRGYMVQFESRVTSTGSMADEWIQVAPGTDGLVALAIGKLVSDTFKGGATSGQYASFYGSVDVGAIATVSGVSAEELTRLATLLTTQPVGLAIAGEGLAGAGTGLAGFAAVQALNGLLGRFGGPGGVSLPPDQPADAFAPTQSASFKDVQALVEDMRAGKVKVLLVHGANPLYELPAAAGVADAVAKVPFVVSFSPAVDETAAFSNLILPDHTALEGWGYRVPPAADRAVITSQQPVMRPLFDTRATGDVLLALARQMGGALGQAIPWANEVEYLKATIAQRNTAGVDPTTFWASWRQRGGLWGEQPEPKAPTAGAVYGAPAALTPGPRQEQSDYPFTLHVVKSAMLSDGRGANKSWLQEAPDPMTTVMWQTWVEISAKTATALGIRDGDIVRVKSAAGEVEAIACTYPGIPDNVVAMPTGQGHDDYGQFAAGRGSNVMKLLPAAVDAASGGLSWRDTRVSITRTGRRQALARLENQAGVEYQQNRELGAEKGGVRRSPQQGPDSQSGN